VYRAKYLIVEERYPILFDVILSHNLVAQGLDVTSAGFVDLLESDAEDGKVVVSCFGESSSLELKPGADDAKRIGFFLERLPYFGDGNRI